MYVTREIEKNDYEFIPFCRSEMGRRGEGREQMWTVVNSKIMHSMF